MVNVHLGHRKKMLPPLGRDVFVKLLPKRRFSKIFEEHLKKKNTGQFAFSVTPLKKLKIVGKKNWLAHAHNLEIKIS